MSNFRIIPVIDLLNSEVVHAIKGERNKYKPLRPIFIDSSNPLKIIECIEKIFNFKEIYVADLDSIINRKPNIELLLKILENSKLKMMLDPGIINTQDIFKFSKLKINKLILGIETLNNINVISDAISILDPNRIIVSIDMYQGRIISNNEKFSTQNPISLINQLINFGIKEFILLDLFRVGQKIGGIPPLYLEIQKNLSTSILIGGGIKEIEDIYELIRYEFDGVLIATALYDGTIKVDEMKNLIKKLNR